MLSCPLTCLDAALSLSQPVTFTSLASYLPTEQRGAWHPNGFSVMDKMIMMTTEVRVLCQHVSSGQVLPTWVV